jgi:hypothetical protein
MLCLICWAQIGQYCWKLTLVSSHKMKLQKFPVENAKGKWTETESSFFFTLWDLMNVDVNTCSLKDLLCQLISYIIRSWDSSVSIVSAYSLDDCGSILSRGEGFSSSFCVNTSSEAHPASYPVGRLVDGLWWGETDVSELQPVWAFCSSPGDFAMWTMDDDTDWG